MSEIPIMVMPWHRPDPCKPSKNQTDAAFKATYLEYLSSLNLDSTTSTVPLTGIMCTIGPSSKEIDMMIDMMKLGMTMALVPLAHGMRQDHIDVIANIRAANIAFSQTTNRVYPLAIAVQTKGPGLRIGGLKKDVPIELPLHHKITLTCDKMWRTKGTEHHLYVGFPEISQVLAEGDLLLIGAGVVILKVEIVDGDEVQCQVVGSGVIHSFMQISVPDVPVKLPPLTDEDMDDLKMVASLGVDIVLATHTETASHIHAVRSVLAEEELGSGIQVWAHIESKLALENLENILEEADAVVLSRMSLTQDVPPEKLFLAQKIALATCNKSGVPVFVSSHFLPSMQRDVTPSVAELSDIAAAILDGADGFVLRNTTSIGRHPEHTVKTLFSACLEAEAAMWHHQTFSFLSTLAPPPIDPTHAIAISAVEASLKTSAAAILLATTSGRSAQLVARYRPRCPIIAITRYGQVARQLNAWRGVMPLHYVDPPLPDWTREVDVRLQFGIEFAKTLGVIEPGDCLVLLNGWRRGAGFTNTIRMVYASESFPWVYPHQLPHTVPTDQAVAEEEAGPRRKTVDGMRTKTRTSTVRQSLSKDTTAFTLQTDGFPRTETIQGFGHSASATLVPSVGPVGSGLLTTPQSKSQTTRPMTTKESVVKSMEEEFHSISNSKSKEFYKTALAEGFRKSRAELTGLVEESDERERTGEGDSTAVSAEKL